MNATSVSVYRIGTNTPLGKIYDLSYDGAANTFIYVIEGIPTWVGHNSINDAMARYIIPTKGDDRNDEMSNLLEYVDSRITTLEAANAQTDDDQYNLYRLYLIRDVILHGLPEDVVSASA